MLGVGLESIPYFSIILYLLYIIGTPLMVFGD